MFILKIANLYNIKDEKDFVPELMWSNPKLYSYWTILFFKTGDVLTLKQSSEHWAILEN